MVTRCHLLWEIEAVAKAVRGRIGNRRVLGQEHAEHLGEHVEINAQGDICLARRRRIGVLGWCSIGIASAIALMFVAAGLFVWSIQREKNSAFLREHFIGLLHAGLGPANTLALDEAAVRFSGLHPTFSVGGLAIANPETGAQAHLDRADVGLTNLSLFTLSPEARTIRFEGLRLVLPDNAGADSALDANEALTLLRALLATVNFAVSGQDPAFRALTTVEGSQISVLRRKKDGGATLIHDGLTASVVRENAASIIARIRKAGQAHGIDLAGKVTPTADGGQSILVDTGDLTAGGIAQLLGVTLPGIDPALRIGVKLSSRLTAQNTLAETGISVSARGGHIVPPDPDMPPFDLDEATLDLRMKPGSPDVLVDRLQVRFNETHFLLHGTLSPLPEPGAGLRLTLTADRAELDRLSASEPPLALDFASLQGVIASDFRSFVLEKLEIREEAGVAQVQGRYSLENGGSMVTNVEGQNFDMRHAMRIWPVWVAPNVRQWLIHHIEAGTLAAIKLETNLAGQALQDAFNRRPVPDSAIKVSYRVEGVRMRPVLDAMPIHGVTASGISTGRRADIEIASGWIEPASGQRFDLQGAKLVVANTALRPALLEMTVSAQGRLDGLLAFLSAPSLKNLVGLPPDATVTDGTFQGQASLVLPLTAAPSQKDTKVEIRAETRGVVIDNIVKGERLEAGAFNFISKSGQVTGKGEGRIFGVLNQIEFRTDAGKTPVALVKSVLDEAILAKRGIDLRPTVTGPIAATFSVPLGKPGPIDVELDLARTKIETGLPGLSKRAGQAGRAKFAFLTRPEGTSLEGFELDLAPASLRGKVELLRDGQFGKAEFSQFRISAGDNAKLTAERSRGVLKLALSGNSFDLRPFMRGFQSGKIEDGKTGDKPPDIDLDLQTTVLVGFNGELMSAAEAKASRRNGRITTLSVKGQFGSAAMTVKSGEVRGDQTAINAQSNDGGALVRFLDIYPRMIGGRLTAELQVGPQSQQGVIQVRDFVIRGEASLRQVAANGRPPSTSRIAETDDVHFTKLRADFARKAGRLDLKEAVMWGAQIGGTLEGVLDYANDNVSLKGAFVPAYGLNNLFANVPLFGPILGGSQYEGLFAVPFVITGKASAPVLRTNPVSAIAPGFLRKFFEIQREQ